MSSKNASSAVSVAWLPIFFSFFETLKPFVFVGTRKKRAAVRAGFGVRLDEQRDEVGARAVGDERLLAVDDVVVAVALRDRLDAGDVAAGVGLAHAERDDLLAAERRLEELLDLLLRAEVADDRRRHVALDEEAHRHAGRTAARQLFGLGDAEPVVAARAARAPPGSARRGCRARPRA